MITFPLNYCLQLGWGQANINWNSIGSSNLKLKPRGLELERDAPCFFGGGWGGEEERGK